MFKSILIVLLIGYAQGAVSINQSSNSLKNHIFFRTPMMGANFVAMV